MKGKEMAVIQELDLVDFSCSYPQLGVMLDGSCHVALFGQSDCSGTVRFLFLLW